MAAATDFFISYTGADRGWATWVAWQLEAVGMSTILDVWDFKPGANFVQRMHDAARHANRTMAILSPDYLKANFTQAEWQAAFGSDPKGDKLVPVRVRKCDLDGLLRQIIYIDLVSTDEEEARTRLLNGVSNGRLKPQKAPEFPDIEIPAICTEVWVLGQSTLMFS